MIWRAILVLLVGVVQGRADLPRGSAAFAVGDSLGRRTNITRQLGLATNLVTPGYEGIGQLTVNESVSHLNI